MLIAGMNPSEHRLRVELFQLSMYSIPWVASQELPADFSAAAGNWVVVAFSCCTYHYRTCRCII
jgi:hypothetical protein